MHFCHLQNSRGEKTLLFCINFAESRVRLHYFSIWIQFLTSCYKYAHTSLREDITYIRVGYSNALCFMFMAYEKHYTYPHCTELYMCVKIYVRAKEREDFVARYKWSWLVIKPKYVPAECSDDRAMFSLCLHPKLIALPETSGMKPHVKCLPLLPPAAPYACLALVSITCQSTSWWTRWSIFGVSTVHNLADCWQ